MFDISSKLKCLYTLYFTNSPKMHLKWTGQNKSTLGILEDLVMFFT